VCGGRLRASVRKGGGGIAAGGKKAGGIGGDFGGPGKKAQALEKASPKKREGGLKSTKKFLPV